MFSVTWIAPQPSVLQFRKPSSYTKCLHQQACGHNMNQQLVLNKHVGHLVFQDIYLHRYLQLRLQSLCILHGPVECLNFNEQVPRNLNFVPGSFPSAGKCYISVFFSTEKKQLQDVPRGSRPPTIETWKGFRTGHWRGEFGSRPSRGRSIFELISCSSVCRWLFLLKFTHLHQNLPEEKREKETPFWVYLALVTSSSGNRRSPDAQLAPTTQAPSWHRAGDSSEILQLFTAKMVIDDWWWMVDDSLSIL